MFGLHVCFSLFPLHFGLLLERNEANDLTLFSCFVRIMIVIMCSCQLGVSFCLVFSDNKNFCVLLCVHTACSLSLSLSLSFSLPPLAVAFAHLIMHGCLPIHDREWKPKNAQRIVFTNYSFVAACMQTCIFNCWLQRRHTLSNRVGVKLLRVWAKGTGWLLLVLCVCLL